MLKFYKLHRDYLKFTGIDRLDLVDRLSSNDIKTLAFSNWKKTILTTDKGRFVDLLTLFNFEDFVFSVCSEQNAGNVSIHLEKYTIMDDFHAENMSGTHESILFFGNHTEEFAKAVFGLDLKLSADKFHIDSFNGKDSIIYNNDDNFGGFIFIYAKEDETFQLKRIFSEENMAKFEICEIDDNEYETMRIEYGIPEFGKEMAEQTNPLECSLERYISYTKGCYIGQEVIARLDAYDKISKHMAGIISDSPIQDSDTNKIKIFTENKECGFLTSSTVSKEFGNIGLGFVKTVFLDYNKEYYLKAENFESKCKIIKLPFKQK